MKPEPMNPRFNPPADDLHWLAHQYASGDLPPAEAEAFEVRLAEDQAAREAVARAVGLLQMLLAAAPGDRNQQSSARLALSSPALWSSALRSPALYSAAAALLLIGLIGWGWRGQFSSNRNSAVVTRRAELAIAWSAAGGELANSYQDPSIEEEPMPIGLEYDLLAGEAAAPDWMTAAIFSRFGRSLEALDSPQPSFTPNENSRQKD